MIDEIAIEKLKNYITENYQLRGDYSPDVINTILKGIPKLNHANPPRTFNTLSGNLHNYIEKERKKITFSVLLEKMREERSLTKPQLYDAAMIDRRLYSKIMGNRIYHPDKNTIFQLGVALKLNVTEMNELLESAGYTLTNSSFIDLTIKFCLENSVFDLRDVNALLHSQGQKVLCGE